jgi:UDP-hydrolysing UDP-N-acetyl-D-glucosamine 2-epimerase
LKRICVATGGRAEWGLLKPLVKKLDPHFDVHILITGQHLSPEYGSTWQEVERVYEGLVKRYENTHKIEMLLSSDTPVGTCKSVGVGIMSYGEQLNIIRPDLLIVLGDRFEIHAVALAAHYLGIPICHIHGGEITEGSFDNALRFGITHFAKYHFVSTLEYESIIAGINYSMGRERFVNIWNVGALGLDDLPEPREIKSDRLMLIYHPVTMLKDGGLCHLDMILECLEGYDVDIVGANSDPMGRKINAELRMWAKTENWSFFRNHRRDDFLRILNRSKAIIGNSSCGIIEAPSLRVGTINVGPRQEGRVQAASVINCETEDEIKDALKRVYSEDYAKMLRYTKSPYGEPGAAERITNILREVL